MRKRYGLISRGVKALASFTVSYAFVIIAYVLISEMGVFKPIDNEKAIQLMCTCIVIAVFHFLIGFLPVRSSIQFFLLYFGVVIAVVAFMGAAVYDFFVMDVVFFVCLAIMLIVVFWGTYLIAYYQDLKKVQEINEIIQQNKKL